jgi:hypothetical protein
MIQLIRTFANFRAIALYAISASLLSACVPPLLTTDIKLAPNDTTARVRFRFVGNGSSSVREHGSAACYAEADPAIRSLAFITYQAHSLNAPTWLSSQPRQNMPNDLGDVSKLTYAEVIVKAGAPLVFSAHWSNGDGFRYYKSWRFLSFTPATGADYEVVLTDDFKIPMRVSVAQLKVQDGKVERTPVEMKPLQVCGTT